MERLGLAYCRLEGLHWDEHIGPKPEGWDTARDDVKFFIVQKHLQRIEQILGKVYLDRCRWVYDTRRSEESWIELRQWMCDTYEPSLLERRDNVTRDSREGIKLTF